MIGIIDLRIAARNKRSPRWIRMLYRITRWERVTIDLGTVRNMQDVLEGRRKKSTILVNKSAYRSANCASAYGLYLEVPSIRNVYIATYAN